jgi:S-DNA-T family DNA segregation ATPase FtsK/SpoIIIE
MLDAAVQVMQRRQAAAFGVTQKLKPSTAEPLIVVLIDELAALTAYTTDRNALKRIKAALELLLSQGRAVGISVIGAIQDPRKETIPMRGLFNTHVTLRLNEEAEVLMVLGKGALDAGAKCHEIPPTLPGVGYVIVDGDPDPKRVRFAHVTEAMLGITKTELPEMAPQQDTTGIFIA